jgi:hypothetical protein
MRTLKTIALTLIATLTLTLNATSTFAAEQAEITTPRPLFVPVPLAADINADGIVSLDDLLEVLANWGPKPKGEQHAADIAPAEGDYSVNYDDMFEVLMHWGETSTGGSEMTE